MDEYIRAGIRKGLTAIGVSCHNPMPDWYDPEHRMSLEEFDTVYKPGVLEMQEKYAGEIEVLMGLEADFFPGTESFVRDFIRAHEFDYILGSVHYLGADVLVPVPKFERRRAVARYIEYYERVEQLAGSGICDIVAHFDMVKKNGILPPADNAGVAQAMDGALRAIRDNDLCIEINTSGLRKKAGEIYPAESILRQAAGYGIPMTVGSDAHAPDDVASDFDRARQLIESYAGGRVCIFKKRRRSPVPIGDSTVK
jgi:histidinol-phosphatase (PHP family)